MRKTLGVAALLLALCCPALAGEMPTPPAPIHTDETAPTAADSLTQIALTLLISVLP